MSRLPHRFHAPRKIFQPVPSLKFHSKNAVRKVKIAFFFKMRYPWKFCSINYCRITVSDHFYWFLFIKSVNITFYFAKVCFFPYLLLINKGQCQLQCIARSNNAWRPFYWQSNSCFGFQSVIYFNHPMVILAHFNRIVTTKHQRNVYNRYLLTFHHFQGKM